MAGFEPAASRSRTERSTALSYAPTKELFPARLAPSWMFRAMLEASVHRGHTVPQSKKGPGASVPRDPRLQAGAAAPNASLASVSQRTEQAGPSTFGPKGSLFGRLQEPLTWATIPRKEEESNPWPFPTHRFSRPAPGPMPRLTFQAEGRGHDPQRVSAARVSGPARRLDG